MEKSKQASKSRERRLRAMYRRKLRVAIVLCLIIGLAIGFVLGRLTVPTEVQAPAPTPTIEPTATPEPTPVPTATAVPSSAPAAIITTIPTVEPTAEPTEDAAAESDAETSAETAGEPTAEPTSEPVQPSVVVVPFNTVQKIPVQVYADGSARNDNQPLPYETLNFQMTVKRHLDNEYYVKNYGATHRLEAGTAGIEFELMLDNYQGSTVIDPNKLIKNVGVESTDGFVTYGYRLTNAEISGSDSFTMQTNVPMNLYKRFIQSDAGSLYLVVTIKIDGVDQVYKFELKPSEEAQAQAKAEAIDKAAANYKELKVGDRNDAVKALQTRLITKGYLEAGSDDGIFGNGTAEAIKKAQTALGMEANGVASAKFQAALFMD